jgi:hypothetical protein
MMTMTLCAAGGGAVLLLRVLLVVLGGAVVGVELADVDVAVELGVHVE